MLRRWTRLFWVVAPLLVAADLGAQSDLDSLSLPALEREVERLRAERSRAADLERVSRALAEAHNTAGLGHWRAARYDSAVFHLNRARDLWTEIGDNGWLGRAYNNLGAAHYQWGNYEPALESFLRSLSLRRATGDERGQSLVLSNVGRTYLDWQQYDRARVALEEALSVGESAGDPFVQGYALHNLGVLESILENDGAARSLFERSLEFYGVDDPRMSESDAVSGWSLNLLHLALLQVRAGNYEEGIASLEEVLTRAVADEHARREARALTQLGQAYRMQGDLPRAVATLERAIDVSRAAGQRTLVAEALADLALAHEQLGDYRAALAEYRAHTVLRDSIFNQSAVQRIAAMEARAEADHQARENAALREADRISDVVISRQRAVVVLAGALLLVSLLLTAVLVHFNRTGRVRERLLAGTNEALDRTNQELRAALSQVYTLEGLIPICMHCKKVRDDHGFWEAVESYISTRSEARFSHGICTECGPRHYGEDWLQPHGDPGEKAE